MSCPQRCDENMLRILRLLTRVGRKYQPLMFAHIQPHGHATARLSRYFAATCVSGARGGAFSLEEIAIGAHLHDVGKYLVSAAVLLKPESLNEEEFSLVSLHPIYGANILSRFRGLTDRIRRMALHHHEHWDGTGYPDGLSGTTIPIEARIIALADVYTSLRARRSYKQTMTKRAALETLKEMAGQKLDPYMTEDFIKLIAAKSQVRHGRPR